MNLISIGEIIDRAWTHYTKHFPVLMHISAWMLVVAMLNVIATWLSPDVSSTRAAVANMTASEWFGTILYAVTFFLIAPVLSVWISNSLVQIIDTQLDNKTPDIKQINRRSWKLFFPQLLLSLQTSGIMFLILLLGLPGVALTMAGNSISSSAVSLLGTILLLVGIAAIIIIGTRVGISLLFSPFALLLDTKHGRAALRESFGLVKGRWWATCWRVTLPPIIFFIGWFTIQYVLTALLQTMIINIAGLNVELAVRLFTIGQGTLFILLMTLINPLLLTANTLVYRSLKSSRTV